MPNSKRKRERGPPTESRLIVVGWDGADPDLAFRWARSGELPNLARLMSRGAWGPLASTTPPATFPAWTSIFTGLGPGRHGITDFTRPVSGRHAIRFLSASDRRGRTLWQRFDAEGSRSLVLAVPGTHPPDLVRGVFVSGFDGPVTTGIDRSFVHPPEAWEARRARWRRFHFADVQELRVGPGWHEKALARLLVGLGEKAALLLDLMREQSPELVVAVFGESDTASHHFWRFHDPRSPRHDPAARTRHLDDAILRVYRSLDAWLGRILEVAGPDVTVAVVSDHGFQGSSTVAVHLDAALANAGLLAWRGTTSRSIPLGLAREVVLRLLPMRLQERLFRLAGGGPAARVESASRHGAIDWSRTLAHADELDYSPGVRISVRGRDRDGLVEPGPDFRRVLAQVSEALLSLRDPVTGVAPIAAVTPRMEAVRGPFARFAPDLFVEPAVLDGYRVSCVRTPSPAAPAVIRVDPRAGYGAKGRGLDAVHRLHGVMVAAGPGIRAHGSFEGAAVADVLPTLLAASGRAVPADLDGRVLGEILVDTPRLEGPERVEPPPPPRWYLADASARIERRMRALGYLE